MQAATRRNLILVVIGIVLLFLLWQAPGRRAKTSTVPLEGLGTPQPTATVESHWRTIAEIQGSGSQDLCQEGKEVTVPGPWRIRAVPADKTVEVRAIDQQTGQLYARVWAGGTDHGDLATLPQGNGTYCLQIEAEGDYTLHVEAWEAPQR